MTTEVDIINEINSARTNPKQYALKVRKLKSWFRGKILKLKDSNIGIITTEGAAAYEEVANFLERLKNEEELKVSKGLMQIAKVFFERAKDKDPTEVGNINMEEIINEQGTFEGSFCRAIDFGGNTAELAVVNLLVSDGDSSRGQRESVLSGDVHYIGCATGYHKIYGNCSVVLTCSKFVNADFSNDTIKLSSLNNKISNIPPKEEEDMELPQGVKKISKNEKIIIEKGKKKKVTKTVVYMEDGSVNTETEKETIKE